MYGWRARLGLCVPANNNVMEPELAHLLPAGVTIHSTRMIVPPGFDPASLEEMQRQAGRAATELRQSQVSVITYACMSTSIVLGTAWDAEYEASSGDGLTYTTAAQSTVRALRHIAARRVAVLSPYPEAISPYVAPYFHDSGLTITSEVHHPIEDVQSVVHQSAHGVYRWARAVPIPAGTDALCILATDLQTLSVVDALERDLGLPVVTCNTALLWDALRVSRIAAHAVGFGRLLHG